MRPTGTTTSGAHGCAPALATLQGRVVLITEGSRGLGAAVASTLGAAGMRLVLADIAVQRAQDFAAVLAERDIDAIALPLDVSDPAQCIEAIDRVAQRFGRLDALISNAANDTSAAPGGCSAADWQRRLATHLSAPYVLSNHAVTLMAEQRGGHIVDITSAESERARRHAGVRRMAAWGASGAAQDLHAELRPQGIQVTAVRAHGPRTHMQAERHPGAQARQRQDLLQVAQLVHAVLQQPAAAG